MRLLPPTDAASYDLPADAPPTYGWRRGATILYGFVFHNSLSVPITVTGPTGDEDGQTGLLTEPRLYVPRPPLQVATTLAQVIPLHGLRIGAGQDRELVLVWHTRGTCARIASRERDTSTGEQIQAVHLRYTLLGGLVSETDWVPVAMSRPDDGSQGYLFGIEAPPIRDCPAGYPPPTP